MDLSWMQGLWFVIGRVRETLRSNKLSTFRIHSMPEQLSDNIINIQANFVAHCFQRKSI
jgi:hypothetical protein